MKTNSLVVSLIALSLVGCSRIQAPADEDLKKLEYGGSQQVANPDERDPEMDEAVANGCLAAWRKALKGDAKGAMSDLAELDKTHPNTSTIQLMMGQIMELKGKHKQAADFYHKALQRSRYSSLYLFKYAESLRNTGDAQKAIPEYKTLIKQAPKFAPAHVGLARALLDLDKNSKEARAEVKQALMLEPENAEAKQLSSTIK